MPNNIVMIAIISLILITAGCSDDLTKTSDPDKYPRIEFSKCIGCYECLDNFKCPQNALLIDERTHKVYLDQSRCIKCYDCINEFSCPEKAITRLQDTVPPAPPQNIMVISDSIGCIDISFTAPGDDSLSGSAYIYDLDIFDQNWQLLNTDYIPPLPKPAGFEENWHLSNLPPYDTLSVYIKAFDEEGWQSETVSAEVIVKGEYFDNDAPSSITDLSAESEEYSITLTWTAPLDPEPRGSEGWNSLSDAGTRALVTEYEIRYAGLVITEENWELAEEIEHEIVPQSPGSIEEMVLEYSEPSGFLYFAVRSIDDAGNISGLSNTVSGEATTDITAPSAINDLNAGNPGNTTVPLTWTAPGDNGDTGSASYYLIRYSQEIITQENWLSAEIFANDLIPQPAGNQESVMINNLQPETGYYFAIIAIDDAENHSEISNSTSVITEATPDLIPPDPVTDLMAAAGEAEIVLNWTATGDDGETGSASEYVLYYAQEEINESNLDMAVEIDDLGLPQPAGSDENYTIFDLEPGIEWYFVIIVSDEEQNSSGLSNNANAMIALDETPPAVINDLTAIVSGINIFLTWTAPGDDGMEGTAQNYDLRYGDTSITELNWDTFEQLAIQSPAPAGTSESLEIENLELNTQLYFALKTMDDDGNISDMSNICTAYIEADAVPPSTITDIYVIEGQIYNNSITINWTAPGDDGDEGTCSYYEIRYSFDQITEDNWNSAQLYSSPPLPQPAGSNQSCQITGLTSGEIIYIAIRGFDEAGNCGGISNNAAGKIVYQITASQCHDCNQCIWRCDQNAIYDAGQFKVINPDLCIACGECNICPYNAIHLWVIAY